MLKTHFREDGREKEKEENDEIRMQMNSLGWIWCDLFPIGTHVGIWGPQGAAHFREPRGSGTFRASGSLEDGNFTAPADKST